MAKNVKPDVVLKRFWSDNAHFADLFNAVVFNGEQILSPECLEERNVSEAELIEWKDKGKTMERMRDVVKKSAFGVDFVILGIENQMKVHYAMPLRVMLYDGLQYLNECNEIIKAHKKEKKIGEKDEFLSGIKKDDRIHPVITVVVYYNENEWDGPVSLHDMMVMPEQIKPLVHDYGMHLIQVRSSDSYPFQNKEVKTVFNISCKIYNKEYEDLKRLYQDEMISSELGLVIGTITGSQALVTQALKKKGRGFNMCKALEELVEQGREEGREEGVAALIETCKEFNQSLPETKQRIMKRFSLSAEDAQKLMEKYW